MIDILGHVPVLIKSMTLDDERKITFEIPQSRHWYRNLRVKYTVKAENGSSLYKGVVWRLPTRRPRILRLPTRLRIWRRVQPISEQIIVEPSSSGLEPLATIKNLRLTRNIASLLYLFIQIVWSMTNAKAVDYVWRTARERRVLTAAIKELNLTGNTLVGLRSLMSVIRSFGNVLSAFMLMVGIAVVFAVVIPCAVGRPRRWSDLERMILKMLLVNPMQVWFMCSVLPLVLIGPASFSTPSLIAPLVNAWFPIMVILDCVRPRVRAYMVTTDYVADDRPLKEATYKGQ